MDFVAEELNKNLIWNAKQGGGVRRLENKSFFMASLSIITRRPGTAATEDNQGLSETCTASALGKAIVEGKQTFYILVFLRNLFSQF